MARSVEQEIALISTAGEDPGTEGAREVLERGLSSRRNVVVAAAAREVAEAELFEHTDALTAAFDRFMHDPAKRDKGCLAKTAIALALYRLEAPSVETFLAGIRHVQREPRLDTAMDLRCHSAMGLVRGNYHDVMVELAELLADPEVMPRCAAARGIAYSRRRDQGLPLLRYKVLAGDPDPRVIEASMEALLELDPDHSLDFVAGHLEDENVGVREAAALALGGSRRQEAFAVLKLFHGRAMQEPDRRLALLALAMLRLESAVSYLTGVIEDSSETSAREAIEALATYRHDVALARRVRAVAEARGEPQLVAHVDEHFNLSGLNT